MDVNVKLSTKIAGGFAVILVLMIVVEAFSFIGLQRIDQKVAVSPRGVAALDALKNCGMYRRDFEIHGSAAVTDGESRPSEELSAQAMELNAMLFDLRKLVERGRTIANASPTSEAPTMALAEWRPERHQPPKTCYQ